MSRTSSLVAGIIAVLALPATVSAGTPFTLDSALSGSGGKAKVLTDPSTGTGHVVWAPNETTIKYCAVARGASTCTPQTLPTTGVTDQVGNPFLVRDPADGTLYVLLHRYASSNIWRLKSTDGGASWQAGESISAYGEAAGTDPTTPTLGPLASEVTMVSSNPGRYVRSVRLDGTESATNTRTELPSGGVSFLQYNLGTARSGGGLVAVANNLDNLYWWSLAPGSDPSVAANWSAAPTLIGPGNDSTIGGPPTGTPFIAYKTSSSFEARRWNGSGFEPPKVLETASGYMAAIRGADPNTVAIAYRLNGSPHQLRAAVSTDNGATWGTRTLTTGSVVYSELAVSPATDGGGWAVWRDGANLKMVDLGGGTGGSYTGPTQETQTSDRDASYTLGGVPKECVNPGATFKVTLKYKRKKRKGSLFVKIRRVDFYIGKKVVKTDKKAPFVQRLTVTISAPRGGTQTLRARAFIKVKRGKSPTKSIRTTFKVCP